MPGARPRPAFAKSAQPQELWVMILEKAFAKLHSSYEAIEGGFVDQALADLTGGIAARIDINKVRAEVRNGALWTKLVGYSEAGYLMGAGTPAGADSVANASPVGIVQGHAYSLLDVQEVDGNKLVKLRNPWGNFEWKGAWSDGDAKWTERIKNKLHYVNADDGVFWMDFVDFTTNFEDIYICKFFESPKWTQHPIIIDEWKGKKAGGCTNNDTVVNNPQYQITVTQPTDIVISLAQEDVREKGQKNFAIAIELYNNRGQRVSRSTRGKMVLSNPESYFYIREVTAEGTLTPSPTPYTLLLSTFHPNQERTFYLQIYYTAPITIEPFPAT
eukprot:TRINITY_DN17575_c0_g1_i1.p1 TRINITY_DN17575_c0_g1~~TRINITY_DN17575_c0_g1_i1.p1  ORF type:complete len:330 (-),score=56.75 TRINITY_DN17575_c0_g1_i1:53-1042(-)